MGTNAPRRVALLTHDSLGNYVVATPLIAAMRHTFPQARIEYVGGPRTKAFWSREPKWDAVFGYDEAPEAAYDLVISTERDDWAVAHARRIVAPEGTILGPGAPEPTGLAADPDWTSKTLLERYPELQSQFIAEVYARTGGLTGEIGAYQLPKEPAEPHGMKLLISCSASLEEKLWPTESWLAALRRLGLRTGLVGVKPKPGAAEYCGQRTEDELAKHSDLVHDLRSVYSLPQLVSAVEEAKAVLTIDNGIMHLAAATETPIVGLFRDDIVRLWKPNISSLHAIAGDPVAEIPVESVVPAVEAIIEAGQDPASAEPRI